MILFWWLQASRDPGAIQWTQFWPATAIGWITFVMAAFGLVGVLYGYAKQVAALNGVGGRVDELKQDVLREKTKNEERDKIWAGMVQGMADLQRQIGEAKHTAEQCDSNSENYFIQIGSQIAELGKKVDASTLAEHGRLVAIETELRLRNQATPLYIEKKP